MVSDKLIEIWKRTGNIEKLIEHGISTEPQPRPQPISRTKVVKNTKMSRPITFRATEDNLLYLDSQSNRSFIINVALDNFRKKGVIKDD